MVQDELIERLLGLWENPPKDRASAVAAFLEVYTDPVRVNGSDLGVEQLVARAHAMAATLSARRTQILSTVADGDTLAIAFRVHATHAGVLATPLGDVAPTGREVSVQVIDILKLREGRISEIWMVTDTFGQLLSLDALRLKSE